MDLNLKLFLCIIFYFCLNFNFTAQFSHTDKMHTVNDLVLPIELVCSLEIILQGDTFCLFYLFYQCRRQHKQINTNTTTTTTTQMSLRFFYPNHQLSLNVKCYPFFSCYKERLFRLHVRQGADV